MLGSYVTVECYFGRVFPFAVFKETGDDLFKLLSGSLCFAGSLELGDVFREVAEFVSDFCDEF